MSPKDYYLLYCGGLEYYYLENSEFYHFFECVFVTPKGHKFHNFSVARFTTLDGVNLSYLRTSLYTTLSRYSHAPVNVTLKLKNETKICDLDYFQIKLHINSP